MIVLDASALIAHLDADDAQHERAVERMIELAEHPLGCSSITLAEVLVGPARAGRLDAAERVVRELGVTEIRLGEGAARASLSSERRRVSSCPTAAYCCRSGLRRAGGPHPR